MTESAAGTQARVGLELSMDQRAALHRTDVWLGEEFAAVFTAEVIDRFPISSYTELAALATIPNYLPPLAKLFARQRLRGRLPDDPRPTLRGMELARPFKHTMAAIRPIRDEIEDRVQVLITELGLTD